MSTKKVKKESTESERKSMASELGRHGGNALFQKHGAGHMKKIGKKGAKSRWKDHEKS